MGEVNDVLFHPNGKFFFTAGMEKKVKMWAQDRESYTKKFDDITKSFLIKKVVRAEFTGANQGITRLDLDADCRFVNTNIFD